MQPNPISQQGNRDAQGITLDHCMARLFTRWRKKADRALKAGAAVRNGLARAAVTGLLAAGLAGNPSQADASAAPDRLNVIHIMADDQNWTNLRCYGNPKAMTPNIDSLARGGVIFSRAMPVCPICAPARTSLLTGAYPTRFASYINNSTARFPVTASNIGRAIAAAGYQTAFIGKTHFDVTGTAAPNADVPGTMREIGFLYTDMAHPYVDTQGTHFALFERSIDSTLNFITRNRDNPFVALVYVTPTHGFHEAPQQYLDRVAPWGGDIVDAMTAWLDDNIGRITKRLDSLGIRGRTVILYSSDNATTRSNLTGFGNKQTVYDEPVPFIVNCPGRYRAGLKISQVVQDVDVFPTIMDLCGAAIPAGFTPDGRSFKPLIEEQPVAWRTSSYYECEYARAVLSGRWKYIALRQIPGVTGYNLASIMGKYGGVADLLFNLAADSAEKNNLAGNAAYADTLAAMKTILAGYMGTFGYGFGEFNNVAATEPARPLIFKVGPALFSVYNMKGQLVQRFTDGYGFDAPGFQRIGRGLSNGVYLYRIATASAIHTGKRAVVR